MRKPDNGLKDKDFTRQDKVNGQVQGLFLDMSIDPFLCGLTSQRGNQNFAAMAVIVYASNLRLRSSVASQPAIFEHISKLLRLWVNKLHIGIL